MLYWCQNEKMFELVQRFEQADIELKEDVSWVNT